MSLHIVSRNNGPWRPGTWFECFDDGCMRVEIETVNNRVKGVKETGIILPWSEIEPWVATCMKKGLNNFNKQMTSK